MQRFIKMWMPTWLILFLVSGFYTLFTMAANTKQTSLMGLVITNIQTNSELTNTFGLSYGNFFIGILAVGVITFIIGLFVKK